MAVVSTATSLALSPAVGTFLPSSSPSSPSSNSLSLRSLFLSLPNKPGFLSVGRRQQRIGDVTGRVFRRAAGVTMSLEAGIGVMGTKLGMMTYFEPQGAAVPVTVVGFREGNIVTQVKTGATDGYEAVQVGYRRVRDKKLTKPELGHLQKAATIPMRHLQEFRLQSADGFEPGQKLAMDEIFKEGDLVDISGTSIGKGFQGGIKRHNFRRGLMTHGSKSHRALGSIGAGTTPGRVYKGKKMPGRMGGAKTKIRKLKIVKIDNDLRVMMIKGAVPDEMNVLINYQSSPASGNGQYYYSVLPASSSRVPARPSCSKYYHRPQHRSHQDYACHRQHLLAVALTLPPPPLPASPPRSVQPSRSSCSPTPPLAVGNSINIGGSPLQRDDHHEPLPIHRSADHDAVVDEELKGPLITSGTLGFDEYRYLRQQTSQEYYLDRPQRQQHQQLLLSPDHHDHDQEPAPPRVVLTLAVSVASAVKLQSKQMDQIAKKMRKLTGFEHLRMENTVDPSLIAGFVIRYGGDDAHHVIDLSVTGHLAEMEARLQSSDQTGAGAASIPGMH